MVKALDLRFESLGFDSRPFRSQVTTLFKLLTHVLLSPVSVNIIGTSQRAVIPYGWKGNRRSGIALAIRHRQ